jgi:hypothetical protein
MLLEPPAVQPAETLVLELLHSPGELQVVSRVVGLLLVPLLLDGPERLLLQVTRVGEGFVDAAARVAAIDS